MRLLKQKKFKHVDVVPLNPLVITFHKNLKRTRVTFGPKVNISIWGVLAASALMVVIYPFLPVILYNINPPQLPSAQSVTLGEFDPNPQAIALADSGSVVAATSQNRIIIPKIGVNISVADLDKESEALAMGAWHFPQTSTPDMGSNSAFSAHRYQYSPPHSQTFYLLDKLEIGDTFTIIWENKEYVYSVNETKIVSPYAVEVLDPTQKSTVTLITCNPLFSTKERLVVSGELISIN